MNTQSLTASPQPSPIGKGVNALAVLSPKDVIEKVRGLLKQSHHRVSAYPSAVSYQSNMILINTALLALNDAEAVHNNLYRVKAILKLRMTLEQLAPRSPFKWRETYLNKVHAIMSACREYLGWEEQR